MKPEQTSISELEKEKLVGYIKQLKLFATFTKEELYSLVSAGRIDTFNKGASIVVEGENTQGLNVITEGMVSVYKSNPTSDQLVRLAHLEPGAVFGELSLINNAARAATVTAETVSKVFNIDASNFTDFLIEGGERRQLAFYKNCSMDLAERFREQNEDYLNTQRLLWEKAFSKDNAKAL